MGAAQGLQKRSEELDGNNASQHGSGKTDASDAGKGVPLKDYSAMTMAEYEKLIPHLVIEFNGKKVVYIVNNQNTEWRVQTLFSKEPDTIEWISQMKPGEILYDIGANVGMYTIWAAVTSGVKVYAFEPESQNYALLNRNILANKVDAEAFCIAISDEMKFDKLYLSIMMAGGSCHNFAENIDYKYKPRTGNFAQGCFAMTLSDLVESAHFPVPNHIKIDVDGIEPKVISGGHEVLSSTELKSVLVELNSNLQDHMDVVNKMKEYGFSFKADQVQKARRKDGNFKGVGNYIFRR